VKWIGPGVLLLVIVFAISYVRQWAIFPLLAVVTMLVVLVAIVWTAWAEMKASKEKP
jgi:hypothetical protein